MTVITTWTTTELEYLAAKIVSQQEGQLQFIANERAAKALIDFARTIATSLPAASAPRVVTDDDALRFYRGIFGGDTQPNSRTLSAFKEQLESFATSMPAAIPPGCVVVPVEPTEEMIMAASNAAHDVTSHKRWMPSAWRAAIAAAPQAGES